MAKLEAQTVAEHAKHAALLEQHAEQEEKAKAANKTLKEVPHSAFMLLNWVCDQCHSQTNAQTVVCRCKSQSGWQVTDQ